MFNNVNTRSPFTSTTQYGLSVALLLSICWACTPRPGGVEPPSKVEDAGHPAPDASAPANNDGGSGADGGLREDGGAVDSGQSEDASLPDLDAGGTDAGPGPSDAGGGWDFGPLIEDAGILEVDAGVAAGARVTVLFEGDGWGSVDIGAVFCRRSCTFISQPGTLVGVAAAGAGSTFGAWMDPSCATPQCSIDVAVERTVRVRFDGRENLAFVTSEQFIPGALGGARMGDALCNRAAGRAGLPGNYVAWLSEVNWTAGERLAGARGWVRVDGRAFTGGFELSDEVFYSLRLTELGTDIRRATVTTGSESLGHAWPVPPNTCGDYTDVNDVVASGYSDQGWFGWSNAAGSSRPCAVPAHLYCFQKNHNADLLVSPPPGAKRVFAADLDPGFQDFTGMTAPQIADIVCQHTRAGVPLDGMFAPWIADVGVTALERSQLGVGTWARADGAVVVEAATPESAWLAAPFKASDGRKLYTNFVTGAARVNSRGDDAETCNDWTSVEHSAHFSGSSSLSTAGPYHDGPADSIPCDYPKAVVCFER